jgi:hypothetical protein
MEPAIHIVVTRPLSIVVRSAIDTLAGMPQTEIWTYDVPSRRDHDDPESGTSTPPLPYVEICMRSWEKREATVFRTRVVVILVLAGRTSRACFVAAPVRRTSPICFSAVENTIIEMSEY